MRFISFLKQFLACLIVAAIAFAFWVWLDPNARNVLNENGLGALAVLAPEAAEEASAMGQDGGSGRGGRGRRGGGFGNPLVTVAEVSEATMDRRFETIGTGLSLQSVTLRPNEAGQIKSIAVKSGDRVETGDLIVQLQDEAQVLAVERAQLSVDLAREKVERYARLSDRGTISSVETDQARSDLATAEVALREAQFALSQRRIEAPIGGTVGIVEVDPGEMLTTSTDIVRIEDYSSLLVTFYVPERLAAVISADSAFKAQTEAVPGATFEGEINSIDNRLEEASRTLRVRGEIPNTEGLLRPGMSFQIQFELEGNRQLAVPPLAIQWNNDGAYVWTLGEDETVAKTPISVIQRNTDLVLVEGENLSAGMVVIEEGVESVREGGGVQIANAGAKAGSTASIRSTGGKGRQAGE
ncbi:efflux RND transporter periplasmic adaptor subunit [Notoacmeibacter sp. MSK16QG-6]|uniref:efflux RND transporter periplasmic adaptor subunit n=1 Tax=Notoacmeibacter sp. MSK16QG-6 TaxID=2957982 RepID=UPI0020A0E35F|nr:efflux RND transporter periplasmic adaptor subunit [Notoacmeibacter sp. MSK16QG-6]MCP1200429.1 efflux RND transporter periplasmic adaptor subunit [Notoacmeibacter sp. MSK16QG-6]